MWYHVARKVFFNFGVEPEGGWASHAFQIGDEVAIRAIHGVQARSGDRDVPYRAQLPEHPSACFDHQVEHRHPQTRPSSENRFTRIGLG